MKLPIDFLNNMKSLLGDEYDNFLASYDGKRYQGLRVNTLKLSAHQFKKISPFKVSQIPWANDGFYYENDEPGKHPYYYAGLYYIQEPSAMLPGYVLNAKPGDKVLDLCAAPGGKTTQIAASMNGQGLLVANEINSNRVKALVKNIELSGVKNAIVTNETPDKLSKNFEEFFDKILVDAPCSGEGMFRKDEDSIKSWMKYNNQHYCNLQKEILINAHKMLKPGGYIVYSTCTFSPVENEMVVSWFVKNNNYEIIDIIKQSGIENGRPEWLEYRDDELSKTARLWPHKVKGEGHFVALLKKGGYCEESNNDDVTIGEAKGVTIRETKYEMQIKREGNDFIKNNLNLNSSNNLNEECQFVIGNALYCLPEKLPNLHSLKVAKFGCKIGEFENNKFQPSHSLILTLKKDDILNTIDFASDSKEIIKYLKGETLIMNGSKALYGICVDGFTLGLAKHTGELLKNLYPKGWRKMK